MDKRKIGLPAFVGDELRTAFQEAAAFTVVIDESTSKTLAAIDAGRYLRFNSSSAVSVTIPPQSSVAWDADTEFIIEQAGAGQVTIVAGSGVMIRNKSTATLKTAAQYSVITLKRVAENEWVMGGDRESA